MPSGSIRLEGIEVIPAKTEGKQDVYSDGNFVLAKPRWVTEVDSNFVIGDCVHNTTKLGLGLQ